MKVLVTGATGLLGGNIVRELVNRNCKVTVFIRKTAVISALQGIECERVIGNLNNYADLVKAAQGCDVVIHTAAITDQWPVNYEHYEEVNVNATLHILRVVRELKISKMIYVSTANTFGYGAKNKPASELSEFNLFNYNSGYIMSKFVAHQHVLAEIEKNRLPVVIVNPAFMIGPYDSKPSSGKILLMADRKKVLPCPPGGKSFIDVRDASTAICNAITMGRDGECYLLANYNLSYWEFFEMLSVIKEMPLTKIYIPRFLMLIIGLTGSFYEWITNRPSKLNYTNARLLCLKLYYSGAKARKELKMPQTPLSQSIADALRWFENNNMIKRKEQKNS